MSTLVVGNWKLNGTRSSVLERVAFFTDKLNEFTEINIIVCSPYVYLEAIQTYLQEHPSVLQLGAQDLSAEFSGAFTGEVSGSMLKDVGTHYVLVGHSERRRWYFEDNALIARKWLSAYDTGLTPILCVGETLEQREAGQTMAIVQAQLEQGLQHAKQANEILVAYEPVWAIGTGKHASPEQVAEVHGQIKSWLTNNFGSSTASVLYGGSVNPQNAQSLFAEPKVDGVLVGGASWDMEAFVEICQQANAR